MNVKTSKTSKVHNLHAFDHMSRPTPSCSAVIHRSDKPEPIYTDEPVTCRTCLTMETSTARTLADRIQAARADLMDARPGPAADRAQARITRACDAAEKQGILDVVLALVD